MLSYKVFTTIYLTVINFCPRICETHKISFPIPADFIGTPYSYE